MLCGKKEQVWCTVEYVHLIIMHTWATISPFSSSLWIVVKCMYFSLQMVPDLCIKLSISTWQINTTMTLHMHTLLKNCQGINKRAPCENTNSDGYNYGVAQICLLKCAALLDR